MTTAKRLGVLSVISGIVSLILYCCVLFMDDTTLEFDGLFIILYLAKAFLVLTIAFTIAAILISKSNFKENKIKKLIAFFCAFISIACFSLIFYNYIIFYDGYEPERIIETDKEYIQGFFPCHNIAEEDDYYVEVSHITGINKIRTQCYGEDATGITTLYSAEYFESTSLCMNLKFYLENGLQTYSDMIYTTAFTKCEKTEVDGVSLTVFTKGDSKDYGVYIRKGNKAIYAELDAFYLSEITLEDFAKNVIEQFSILEKAAKDKVFFDIPISEKFSRRILKQN